MAKKPEDRYQTARDMHIALENYLSQSGEAVLEFHVSTYLTELAEKTGDAEAFLFKTPLSRPNLSAPNPAGNEADTATGDPEPRMSTEIPSVQTSMVPKPRGFPILPVILIAFLLGAGAFLYLSRLNGTTVAETAPPPTSQPPAVVAAVPAADARVQPTQKPDVEPEVEADAGPELEIGLGEFVQFPNPDKGKGKGKRPVEPPTKGTATLTVRASPWCTLYVDSKKVGDTPISGLKLKAGRRKLRCVNKSEKIDKKTTITLAAGEVKSETFRFKKGKLNIRVKPWGEVWVDGQRKGVTPFGAITVFEGSHKIKATNSDLGVTRTVRARVGSGQTTQFRIDLSKK
jgi:hypothetical protein